VFGLVEPAAVHKLEAGRVTGWFDTCNPAVARELETGQVLIDKPRAWAGLRMSAAINARGSVFFFKRLFKGDKMTFHFGFAATGTPYSLAAPVPQGLGMGLSGFSGSGMSAGAGSGSSARSGAPWEGPQTQEHHCPAAVPVPRAALFARPATAWTPSPRAS
jgi:hypothetical protein